MPEAVQHSGAGQKQAAALRQALCAEAQAQVFSCLTDPESSKTELAEWGVVAKSLNEGCFVEQDTATLLSGLLGVTVYVIANTNYDHLQVTKYAGELLHCMQSKCMKISSGVCTIDLDFD